MKGQLPKRRVTRLKGYNYSTPGAYFITVCTKNRKALLSTISVGTGVLDGPKNQLSAYGNVADKHIRQMSAYYSNISVDHYVIMPNHIHLLVRILPTNVHLQDGPPRTSVPTDSILSNFVSTLKRFCNKEYGQNIWQYRSHDHIIRNEQDYQRIWRYIDTNVIRWERDCFYTEKTEI